MSDIDNKIVTQNAVKAALQAMDKYVNPQVGGISVKESAIRSAMREELVPIIRGLNGKTFAEAKTVVFEERDISKSIQDVEYKEISRVNKALLQQAIAGMGMILRTGRKPDETGRYHSF